MGTRESTTAKPCIIRERPHFTDLAYSSEPMIFQRANVELTARTIILCVTKENITCGLHHLLAFHNTSALMPVVSEPATEPFQYGSLGLLKLKEEGFAVTGHQQRNKTGRHDGTDDKYFNNKDKHFMPV